MSNIHVSWQAELVAFYESHFSPLATAHFGGNFLRPRIEDGPDYTAFTCEGAPDLNRSALDDPQGEHYQEGGWEEEEYWEEEDDGLGYYPDGVKRTLTEEQIAIFRHSEMEALRRAQEASGNNTKYRTMDLNRVDSEVLSESEITSAGITPTSNGQNETSQNTNKKKKKKRKRKANGKDEEPIDLRKRTWDVVGAGLETLDYDDEGGPDLQGGGGQVRRVVSYDD